MVTFRVGTKKFWVPSWALNKYTFLMVEPEGIVILHLKLFSAKADLNPFIV